jgi:peptidyl-prolyl cis-trans isomerase A (cyclophilin A)
MIHLARPLVCLGLALSLTHAQEPKPSAKPAAAPEAKSAANPKVEMKTSMGVIEIELDKAKAPTTVENFLKYVEKKQFDGTVFHRVIDGFMIQGGGFEKKGDQLVEKATDPPIKNEASNGLKNAAGTIAMARTQAPDSATSQFFINVADNSMLDQTPKSVGYAVFGRVVKGMEVVNQIKGVKTGVRQLTYLLVNGQHKPGPGENVPISDVVIESVRLVPPAK